MLEHLRCASGTRVAIIDSRRVVYGTVVNTKAMTDWLGCLPGFFAKDKDALRSKSTEQGF